LTSLLLQAIRHHEEIKLCASGENMTRLTPAASLLNDRII
jgi:hypothetical protein